MSERVLLARRASGHDHAVVFEADRLRLEGGFGLRRAVAYRSVDGIERLGRWLWLGAGRGAVGLGGRDVPPERLDAVEAAVRRRIAALPDGAGRLVRIDRRRQPEPHAPFLAAAVLLIGAALSLPTPHEPWRVVAELAFLASFGVVAEGWLGHRAAFVSGAAGLAVVGGFALALEPTPAPGLAAGWIGLLAFARLVRKGELPVLARGAIDVAAIFTVAFAAIVASRGGAAPMVVTAAVAGFAAAPLGLGKRRPR